MCDPPALSPPNDHSSGNAFVGGSGSPALTLPAVYGVSPPSLLRVDASASPRGLHPPTPPPPHDNSCMRASAVCSSDSPAPIPTEVLSRANASASGSSPPALSPPEHNSCKLASAVYGSSPPFFPPSTIRALACSTHTLAATNTGALYSWGRRGALGHTGSGALPQRVLALAGVRIIAVAVSPSHSLAVSADGVLFSFGSGESGQLGHCDWEPQPIPARVMSLAAVVVTAVACGDYCSFALSDDGAVYSWGLSPSLGHGQHGASQVEEPAPRRVEALRGERVAAIAAGPAHVLAACADGRAYGWGIGCDETLGLPQLGGGDALLPVAYDVRMRVDVGSPGTLNG